MRFKQHALLVLLVLISACANSDSGLTRMEASGGSAGSFGSFGSGNLSCLFNSWNNIGINLILIIYFIWYFYTTGKEHGATSAPTLLSGGMNAIIFAVYVLYGGYCQYGWIMAPILILQSLIQKEFMDKSRTYQLAMPAIDAILISYIIQNPTLVKNPYSFLALALSPILFWYVSGAVAKIGAERLGQSDWNSLKHGFTPSFVKGLKNKLQKGINAVKKRIPKGKGKEGKVEALEAKEDVEVEKKLVVMIGRIAELLVLDATVLARLKIRAKIMINRIKNYKNCLSALRTKSGELSQEIKNMSHATRKENARKYLLSNIPALCGVLEKAANSQKKEVDYLAKIDEKGKKTSGKENTLLSQLETEEKRLQKTEDSFKKTEKFEIKVIDEEIAKKKKEMHELQRKIKESNHVVEMHLGATPEQLKSHVKALENGRAEIDKTIKKLKELETKVHKVLRGARKDINAIKTFEKHSEKLQQELRAIDERTKKSSEQQEEALKSIKEYEPMLPDPAETPENISVEIMSRFGRFFVAVEDTSKAFSKEAELYSPYLLELRNATDKTSRLIQRNSFVINAQEYHDKCWKELNALLASFHQDGKSREVNAEYFARLDEFITTIDKSYEEDKALINADAAKLQDNITKLNELIAETGNLPAQFNETTAFLVQERDLFLTDMHEVLAHLLSEDEQKIQQFQEKTAKYRSNIRSEESRFSRSYRFQKVKKYAKTPMRAVGGLFARFNAGRKVREQKEGKPPAA